MRTLGTTRRTQTVNGQEVERIQHAATSTPSSRTGRGVWAECGASVYPQGVPFDPEHPRACPRCVEATS